MENVVLLNEAISVYEKKFHRKPSSLYELVANDIIRELPHDPAGGTYYLDLQGEIKSTSELTIFQ